MRQGKLQLPAIGKLLLTKSLAKSAGNTGSVVRRLSMQLAVPHDHV